MTSKQTKRIGEKIKLTVRGKGGCAPTGISWTIPGTVVKDYQDDSTTATVTPLADGDKTNPTVTFYWVDGADGRSVSVSCTCAGAGTKTASVTYDVKAPTLDKFDSKTDAVGLDPAAAPIKLRFGLAGKHGIDWDWKVTVPAGVDGWVKDVQIIKAISKQTTVGGKKQVFTISGTKVPPPDYQLDTTNPYSLPGDFGPVGFPKKVTASSSFADKFSQDTPSNPLPGNKEVSRDAPFKYFIMYKPDTPDSIWVPVAVASWYCKGSTTLTAGTWTLGGTDNSPKPSGSATTTFPEYKQNSASNVWQDE